MSKKNDLINAIRGISQTGILNPVFCTVSTVDLNTFTCDCVPILEAPDILDVKLMPADEDGITVNGFVKIPAIGSVVLVSMITQDDGFVAMTSKLDEVYLNGKNFDGLVKVSPLVQKLNNLEDAFNNHLSNYNNHITAYNTHTHVGVTVGMGATGITTPDTPDTQTLTPTQQSELENTTVLHGDGN